MELGELKNGEGYNKEILKLIQKLNISEDNVEIYKTGYHDMKRERDELSEKLDKECNDNYKLEGQLNDMTKQRDSLIKDVEKQRELLKDFSRFIHRKVEVCPGKKEYMDFRDRLNELGIGERE
ncbi:hypothetical protein [Mammaliicoccus sciuri]|uniref:hypothetical protein n=1 Tax=Mammaliicoccus sciuri TaxID=1296 RepID=UPI000E68CFFD|nr:hypothetical protein [Mammaliicoccus sciuri]RIN99047.1 hypothetical protein BU000_04125 [Mammaliicoccus sciuri]